MRIEKLHDKRWLRANAKRTLHEIARELGSSPTAVWVAYHRAGLHVLRNHQPGRPKGSQGPVSEKARAVVAMWRAGHSQTAIAREFGMSPQAAQQMVKRWDGRIPKAEDDWK